MSRELAEISESRLAYDARFTAFLVAARDLFLRHWLALANATTLALTAFAFIAPALMSIGLRIPAAVIYFFYSLLCHQLPQRSYFVLGFQVAQCHRNTAIFAAAFAGGLAYAAMRGRVAPISWRWYSVLILPMAVDGGTQLIGWRESDWLLRSITGVLFGLASVWFFYPRFEQQLRRSFKPVEERKRKVIIFGKPDCCLCDNAKAVLERMRTEYAMEIQEVDITGDPDLTLRYNDLIPVVLVDGKVAAVSKVSEVWLRRKLAE